MDSSLAEISTSVTRLWSAFLGRLPYVAIAAVVFLLSTLAARGVRVLARRFAERARKHRNAGIVVGRLAYGAILLLGLLVAMVIAIPGFTPGQLVSVLGLSSVAIGFAFRDILQNFLAGILILVNEPFRVGDQIVLKDFEGTVEEIQTRATYLRTYDGRRIVIPNSELFVNAVTVNTAHQRRRIEYDVGIGYGDDVARAKDVLRGVLAGAPEVLAEPAPEVLVWDLGESAVVLRLRWWIQPPQRFEVVASRDAVLESAKRALTEAGIDLPFPTRQILFHDQTEEIDGDRARQREGWPKAGGGTPRPRWRVRRTDGGAETKPDAPA